jgi:hypothetical protein
MPGKNIYGEDIDDFVNADEGLGVTHRDLDDEDDEPGDEFVAMDAPEPVDIPPPDAKGYVKPPRAPRLEKDEPLDI